MSDKKLLPSKSDNLADWYTTLIQLADLADYGSTKGTIVIKPYAYAIWENVQHAMDQQIKAKGVSNAYFPLLIPMSFLEKEKQHVNGFAPELAVVTHAGGEKLEEALVVRPTSETIIYDAFSRWIQSWRDLPLMVNQWCNVVRWEKRTMPFIRTSEFLWQEGHTAHATHDEAVKLQRWAMDMYAHIYREFFAMDGFVGWKSTAERFAGADTTLTFETLMPSGKTLQSVTSHDLGQNFSKVFDISFQDQEGGDSFVWQTSWGLSTRSIGGLILSHGDDNGLRLPPKLAPIQIAIVPILPDKDFVKYSQELQTALSQKGLRCVVDDRDDERFGFKLNKWEVKGVPLLIKIGEREINHQQATVKRRDMDKEEVIKKVNITREVEHLLNDIQAKLLEQSQAFVRDNTRTAKTYDEFKAVLNEHRGFIKVFWNDNPVIEKRIKEETKAKSSCRPVEWSTVNGGGKDFFTGKPANQQWLFAQSY